MKAKLSFLQILLAPTMLLWCAGCMSTKSANPITATPVPTPLNVVPATASIPCGASIRFSAEKDGLPYTKVSWSISGQVPNGTSISSAGDLVVPASPVCDPATQAVAVNAVDLVSNNSISSGNAAVTLSYPSPSVSSSSPTIIVPGVPSSFTLSGSGFFPTSTLIVNGTSVPATVDNTGIHFIFVEPGWISDGLQVVVSNPSPGGGQSLPFTIPAKVPAISYDAAARFLEQSTWGPTDSMIAHVRDIGFSAFLDEQLATGPDYFDTTPDNTLVICENAFAWGSTHDYSQLRTKLTMAFEKLFNPQGSTLPSLLSAVPEILNRDAFGSFEAMLNEVSLNPVTGMMFDYDSADNPGLQPNQNFGRESMQMLTIGPTLLNPDGTPIVDGDGTPMPAYTQTDVSEISRAVTGFMWPAGDWGGPSNPHGEVKLVNNTPDHHDAGSKTILGTSIPAGQDSVTDMETVTHILASHPNVGPYIGRYLIRKFVTSNPSPQYVERISKVWNDDGQGQRGNLSSVIKAILLDPEARSGDDLSNQVSDTEGRFRDAMDFSIAFLRATGITASLAPSSSNGFAVGYGETTFHNPNIFGFYQQTTTATSNGQTILAPESQLYNALGLQAKAVYVQFMLTQPVEGNPRSNIDWTYFGKLASGGGTQLISYANHLMFHGNMSKELADVLNGDVNLFSDPTDRARAMLFHVAMSPEFAVQR